MTNELIPTSTVLAAARKQLATLAAERSVVTANSNGPNPLLNAPLVGEGNPATIYLMLYHGTSKTTHASRLKNIVGYMGAPNNNYEWLSWSQFTAPRVKSFLNSLYEPYIENGKSKRRSPNTLNDPDIDPKTAMEMARHASFNTTARYNRRSGQKRKIIADRLP